MACACGMGCSSCVVVQSVAAQLRILSNLLDSLCKGPDTLTFYFNGVPTMAISMPSGADVLTGNLVATRNGAPFPLPADTVVQSSDPSLETVTLDVATGVVTITRASFAAGSPVMTALGGGLSATMTVDQAAAAATAIAFDEASFVAS